jgi:ElaB/YqjD/DUF883 family membrane-anchored ribosome-binding protein
MTRVQQSEAGTAGSEQSTAEQAKQKVQETAQQVQGQVGEKAREVKNEAGGRLRGEIDTRSTQAGEQMSSTAEAIRRVGDELRTEGNDRPAQLADQAAQRADRLGQYLKEADADQIMRDVENFARRQPWLVAIGGAAVGFLASRFVKASSTQRYQSGSNGSAGVIEAGAPALSSGDAAMASFGDDAMVARSSTAEPARRTTRRSSRGHADQ